MTSSQQIISTVTLFPDNVTLAGPVDDTRTACDTIQSSMELGEQLCDHSSLPLSSAVPGPSLGALYDHPSGDDLPPG